MTENWQPGRLRGQFNDAIKELVARKVKAGETEKVEPLEEAPEGARGIERHRPRRAAQEQPRQARRRRGRQGERGQAGGPPRTGQEGRAEARLTRRRQTCQHARHGATELPPNDPLERYVAKRDFERHAPSRRASQREAAQASSPSSSRSTPRAAALRLPARARRRAAVAGRCPRARASTRPTSAWRSTSRTTRSPTAASRARSRRSSTAPARVIVWDRGTWEPVGDPREGMAQGQARLPAARQKLAGLWELVRIAKPGEQAGAVDPVQEARRLGAAAGRLRRRHGAARQRDRQAAAAPRRASASRAATAAARSAGADAAARADAARRRQGRRCRRSSRRSSPRSPQACRRPATGSTRSSSTATALHGAHRRGQGARSITRGGHDWTAKMPALVARARRRSASTRPGSTARSSCSTTNGTPDFNALQNAFDAARSEQHRLLPVRRALLRRPRPAPGAAARAPRSCCRQLLDEHAQRARALQRRLRRRRRPAMLQPACRMELEGVIAKRADAPYVSRRTETWLKLKCQQRQEFVIARLHRPRSGAPREVGSLLLGVHDDERQAASTPAASAPAGTRRPARELQRKLAQLEVDEAAVRGRRRSSRAAGRSARRAASAGSSRSWWPRSTFAEWTPDGQIRHARSRACAPTSRPRAIVRETAQPTLGDCRRRSSRPAKAAVGGIKVHATPSA